MPAPHRFSASAVSIAIVCSLSLALAASATLGVSASPSRENFGTDSMSHLEQQNRLPKLLAAGPL